MDLAFITPTSYLEKYAMQGGILLALAHLVDDEGQNEYARFHRRESFKGRRVILDNGLFEGAQVTTEQLLIRARAINASVVCAPDVLFDAEGTTKAFKKFIRAKQDFGLCCDVMGIPQADNPTDWWDCYRFMEMSRDCSLIGLSILSIPRAFGPLVGGTHKITVSRMYVIRQLCNYQSLLGRRLKPYHLLGLGESYADIILAQRLMPETVVSNDSSSCFVHGAEEICYDRFGTWKGGKIVEKLDFSLPGGTLTPEQHASIEHNIKTAKEIASWHS